MSALTVGMGATSIVLGTEPLHRYNSWLTDGNHVTRHILTLTLVATLLVCGVLIVVCMWAFALMQLGVFTAFEAAFYFSIVAFTTLGFGDVILPNTWRDNVKYLSHI